MWKAFRPLLAVVDTENPVKIYPSLLVSHSRRVKGELGLMSSAFQGPVLLA